MKTVAEKLDDLLARDTREHNDVPETEDCPDCEGTGYESMKGGNYPNHDSRLECMQCNGTGRVIKKQVNIHEDGDY